MALTVSYPWDPVGVNAACFITGESYALSSINNTYRCIIPESAPFYKKDLAVIHATSGKTLQEGVDYYLGHRYLEVGAIASLELYGSINFINPELFGEIKLNYRTIGGPYIPVKNKVADYLANYLTDPLSVSWEDVFNKPEFYPAEDHEQIWSDFVNTENIAAAVDTVTDAVNTYAANKSEAVIAHITARIAALDKFVTDTQFNQHIIDKANPHDVTWDQTDALQATATAVESLKLYGKTLIELAAYINAKGITQAHLDAYVSKRDDVTLTKNLKLTDGVAIIKSSGLASSVNLNSGNIILSCVHTNKVLANFDDIGDESAYLQAGNNILRVRGNAATIGADDLTYNDKVVIHLGNLRKYLGNLSFGTVHVTVQNTATGAWTGMGTAVDPLVLTPITPTASTTVAGKAKISVATNSTDATAFAASSALASVMAQLTGFIPVTTKINGRPLTSNITFTKDEYGLSVVNNTADLNKPISTAQQAALDDKTPLVHTHDWSSITPPVMSTTVDGIAKLATTRAEVSSGVAAAPSLLKVVYDYYTNVNTLIRTQLLKRNTVSMIHYIPDGSIGYPAITTQVVSPSEPIVDANGDPVLDGDGNPTFTPEVIEDVYPASWWVITMPSGVLYANGESYTVNSTSIDLQYWFGANVTNRTLHVHAVLMNDGRVVYGVEYSILPDTKSSIYIGALVTNGTKVVSDTLSRRVSFGMFKELKEHIDATTGVHNFTGDAAALVGLDLVENYPLQHYAHQFSPLSVVKTWSKFSYTGANDAMWVASNDNCSLLCNLSGLATALEGRWTKANMWDRLHPTSTPGLLRAQATLRDVVYQKAALSTDIRTYCDSTELVLGVYVDNAGNTHTLSLAHYQSSTDPNIVRSKLYYNKGLATEQIIGEYWQPTYGMSFATPPGGVYSVWSKLILYMTAEYCNDNGTKYIQVVLRSNVEWGSPSRTAEQANNRTVTKFNLADLPAFPYRAELLASGAMGLLTRKPANHIYTWFDITTPYSKSAYASANLIMELAKRGTGMAVAQGIATGMTGTDYGLGSSRAITLISPRTITTVAGKGIDTFSFSAFQDPNGQIKMLDSSYLNPTVQQITDGTSPSTTPTYTVTVISFSDEIDLIATD